jgi:hypothetical protein
MAAVNDLERPGVEELYESATNTSNLKQDPERRMPADVLRDMAMSADRLGSKLIRLRAQWESTTRPSRQVPRSVKEFERVLGDRSRAVVEHHADKAACEAAYQRALTALANRLPELEAVRDELTPAVMKRGWGRPQDPITRSERTEAREQDDEQLHRLRAEVESAADEEAQRIARAALNQQVIAIERRLAEEEREDRERARQKLGQVIRYWLNQACTGCGGTRWELIPNTNRQGTKMCKVCSGTGAAPVPQGQEGRWLANHMDQCAHRYQQRLKARRKALASIPAIDRLSKRVQAKVGSRYIDPESD